MPRLVNPLKISVKSNFISAQETELRMVSRSLRAMQNRLSIDEFKEEKLQDTMTQMTLEMLNKIHFVFDLDGFGSVEKTRLCSTPYSSQIQHRLLKQLASKCQASSSMMSNTSIHMQA